MDNATVHKLKTITSQFYATCADSFSATRQKAWSGWQQIADLISKNSSENLQFTDLACGNFRFEKFIQDDFKDKKTIKFSCVDNCLDLSANKVQNAKFIECDIIDCLLNDSSLSNLELEPADYLVSFGFMHHIPSRKLRLKFLNEAMSLIKNGSYLIVSFWQFLKNDSLKQKANKKTDLAIHTYNIDNKELEDGDCFLGWQDKENIFRYCHNFSNEEIDSYIEYLSKFGRLHTSFEADGKSDDLNFYIVMQKY